MATPACPTPTALDAPTLAVLNASLDAHAAAMQAIFSHPGVQQAVAQVQGACQCDPCNCKIMKIARVTNAKGATPSFVTILEAIISVVLPFVSSLLSGGTVDWAAIIAAVTGLLSPAPVPA